MATLKFKNDQGQWEELNAAKLETARLINGVPFDGSTDIDIPTGSGNYDDLSNKPSINNVSLIGNKTLDDLNIQAKGSYIISETDPTVPSWAKQPSKPTYTASEVGALSEDTSILDLNGYPTVSPSNKVLHGDRSFKEIVAGSGGYAANIYLTDLDSDIPAYKQISYTPDIAETILTATANVGTVLAKTYLYSAPVSTSIIDSGIWIFSMNAKVDTNVGDSKITLELFKRDDSGIETALFTVDSPILENTTYSNIKFEVTEPAYTVDPSVRIGVKIYFTSTTNATLSLVIGDGNASYFNTPLALRHVQLRDPNGDPNVQHLTAAQVVKVNNAVQIESGLDTSGKIVTESRKTNYTATNGSLSTLNEVAQSLDNNITNTNKKLDKVGVSQSLPSFIATAYDILAKLGININPIETELASTGNTLIDATSSANKNTFTKFLQTIISSVVPKRLTQNKIWVGDASNTPQEADTYDEFVTGTPSSISQRRIKTLEMEINYDGVNIAYSQLIHKKGFLYSGSTGRTDVLISDIKNFVLEGVDMIVVAGSATGSSLYTRNTFDLKVGGVIVDTVKDNTMPIGKIYEFAVPDAMQTTSADLSVTFTPGDYTSFNVNVTFVIHGYQI